MAGTRKLCLQNIMGWVANGSEEKDLVQSSTYWIYGLPGIGKTSLAHSTCASLDDQRQLAGAFFCRRGDPNLSKTKNILPTLIHKLAWVLPSFRSRVASRLRSNPNLTTDSMEELLVLDFFHNLPHSPNHFLVFIIDAFDECGDHRSRPALLKLLTSVAARVSWLKIIITSRPEADIKNFFDQSSYLRYDLATDKEANHDLRTFAQSQFYLVAWKWRLATDWPGTSLLDRFISRAGGLFIFIKTLALALHDCVNPTNCLKAISEEDGAWPNPLYGLYSYILSSRRVRSNAEFQRVMGVLVTVAPHRALCEETIAELAGVQPNLVRRWVRDLSSLLYRDQGINGGISVRHLSISEFLVSDDCSYDYRINPRDANVHLGIACLKTMAFQLRVNICGLKDSRVPNVDVGDSPPESPRIFPTACSIVLFTGRITFVGLPTIMISGCGKV